MIFKVSEKEPPFNEVIEARKGSDGKWEKVKRTYQGEKPEYSFNDNSNGYTEWRR